MYVQKGSADIQEKNILDDLELEELEFELARKFLVELKKKFDKGDNELTKVVKLKQEEQDLQTMDEFIWMFKHTTRKTSIDLKNLREV